MFCLVGYKFRGGIEGLKQKHRRKKKKKSQHNWDKQQVPEIRSEIFRTCSIKICGTDCVIMFHLTAKLRVKEVSFVVHTWQTGLIYFFLILFSYCLIGKMRG